MLSFEDILSCTRVSLAVLRYFSLHLLVLSLSVNEPSPCNHYHTLLQGFGERVQEADLRCAWLILYHIFWKLLEEGNELKLRRKEILLWLKGELLFFFFGERFQSELPVARRGKVQLTFFLTMVFCCSSVLHHVISILMSELGVIGISLCSHLDKVEEVVLYTTMWHNSPFPN